MMYNNPMETMHNALSHACYRAFSKYTYQDRDWDKYHKWQDEVFRKLPKEQQKQLYDQERATRVAMGPAGTLVEKQREHTASDVMVFAMFPQTWGSTALGFGGIGGQAISSAYVIVLESQLVGEFAVYFAGRHAYTIARPNQDFFADITGQRMADAALGPAKYEKSQTETS